MELKVKFFSALSAKELHDIYRLRVSVFVVEQRCPYQEVDDADERAYHVWLEEDGAIRAYLRVLEPGAAFPECAIGRVIAAGAGAGWERASSRRDCALRRRNTARTRCASRRRLTRGHSTSIWALCRRRRSFWRTGSRTSGCCGKKSEDLPEKAKISLAI